MHKSVAVLLLAATLVPVLALDQAGYMHFAFFESVPILTFLSPSIGRLLLWYPLFAGAVLFALGFLSRGWIRATGTLLVGILLPLLVIPSAGVMAASSGAFTLDTSWDWVLMLAAFLLPVAAFLDDHRPNALTALLCAAGGVLLLAWLLLPRPPSYYETWFGLDRLTLPSESPAIASFLEQWGNMPVVRIFGRNWMMDKGTQPIWYVWWNLLLLAGLLLGVCAACLPLVRNKGTRSTLSSAVLSLCCCQLGALLLLPVGTGAHFLQVTSKDSSLTGHSTWATVVGVVNGCKVWFPPWLLAATLLYGLSECLSLLLDLVPRRASCSEPIFSQPVPMPPPLPLVSAVPIPPPYPARDGWYHAVGKQKVGPLSLDDMRRLVATGQLGHSDMVLSPGNTLWASADCYCELFQAPNPISRNPNATPLANKSGC